jgi:diguanylate cyclase
MRKLFCPVWQWIGQIAAAIGGALRGGRAGLARSAGLGLLGWAWAVASAYGASSVTLTAEQTTWLEAHRDQTWSVGFDPLAGVDSFDFRGRRAGVLPGLLDDMHAELGLKLVQAKVTGWDDAYSRFVAGKIDVLYGANPTPEREKIMRFTSAALKYPYVVFSRKGSAVQTLGDLDGKRVGFIRNDFVLEALPREFPNIHFSSSEYEEQDKGLLALVRGEVDGFVTTGGGVEYEYLYKHASLQQVATLSQITSDMTFAVPLDQSVLAQIIDRYLTQRQAKVAELTQAARSTYNRKVLRLSEGELRWLEAHGEAVVGVAEDYLPFDYYENGEYRGIMGATLQRISELVGIRFKVVSAPFAQVMKQARDGGIDVVDMAKTEDRLQDFLFPHPISTERDIIVGLKSSPPVQDVYGLDGLPVAVIDGFWHEEYLRKNLKNPQIITTQDIKESLRLVRSGRAAYMIENPTVVDFYINGLGYADVVKRGNTSKDSFIYFGVTRRQPELASIMDKVIPLIQFDEMKFAGIQSVPSLRNETNTRLAITVAGLSAALLAILLVAFRYVRKHAEQRAQTRFLKEREHLLYTDALTGFRNRNYFSRLSPGELDTNFPQAVIVADLNDLKPVNDSHGHAAGDALLARFAEVVRAQWPQAECFRTGGDEFVILLAGVDAAAAAAELEAFRARCQETRYALKEADCLQPSAALGFAVRLSAEDSLEACIAAADASMYQSKRLMKKRATDSA